MKKSISLFVISSLIFVGCATQEVVTEKQPEKSMTDTATFTLQEVAKHNSKDDCWLLIDAKVYEVTNFIGTHPGGEAILEGCGKDATELFETRPMGSGTPHSEQAREGMKNFYIGELEV